MAALLQRQNMQILPRTTKQNTPRRHSEKEDMIQRIHDILHLAEDLKAEAETQWRQMTSTYAPTLVIPALPSGINYVEH